MTTAFVIDASLTLSWFLEDEYTDAADALRMEIIAGGVAWVPMLWPFEVTNAILVIHRRGRINEAQMREVHSLLKALPIQIDETPSRTAFDDGFMLAHANKLTSYDAAYLELAQRKALPLATLDKPLRDAAKKTGVALLPEKL